MMNGARTIEVRVLRKVTEAVGIASFELESADGGPLPPFEAGAHINVCIPGRVGLIRQYSLCNSPRERRRYLICVLKDIATDSGSWAMHEHVEEGLTLRISHPCNKFALHHDAGHSMLLAGGIGVTPMLAMAETLNSEGASFELHYSCRTVSRMAFRDRLLQSDYSERVRLHLDDGAPAQRLDLDKLLRGPRSETHVYVCGPAAFIDATLTTARRLGWTETQLHFESFSGRASAVGEDGAFEVTLARSGRVIQVAVSQTVVQALASHGVEVPISCEQGICGTCVTTVIEGEPDHRDLYFTPEEQARNDRFTPCCSRSKTPCMVLDL